MKEKSEKKRAVDDLKVTAMYKDMVVTADAMADAILMVA